MAERAANRRKSQMFLTNISPVTNTFDELVKEKLVCGKFPLTIPGIAKMFSFVFLLSGELIFLVNPTCNGHSDWYPYVFPTGAGITLSVQFILFLIFSFGLTTHNPGFWIKMDIISGFVLSLLTIICAAMSLTQCVTKLVTNQVSGCLGIIGAVIVILSCVAMVLMYRYIEDPNEPEPAPLPVGTANRKSIFA